MKTQDYLIMLSERLGWGDMLTQIAIPALEEIILMGGDVNYIIDLPADEIFGLLAGECSHEELAQFISLRWEIESCMRMGMNYKEAINEWWK